jgi:uncharacterized protein (TIGR02284 family)
MSRHHDISALNSLIKAMLDSMKGFEEAARDAEDPALASLFWDFAHDRGAVAATMQAEVRRLGGQAEKEASFLAAAYRGFIDLKQAIIGMDDKAVAAEVERGEDHVKERFETAMADREISPPTLAVIRQAYESVRAGHERARALREHIV